VNGGTQFAIQEVILNKQVMIMYLNKYCLGKFSKDAPTNRSQQTQRFNVETQRGKNHGKREVLLYFERITSREIRMLCVIIGALGFYFSGPSRWEGGVFISAWVAFMGADISDLRNHTTCTLRFLCNRPDCAAWLLGSSCQDIRHCS